jgi:hypothetical protein
LGGPQQKLGKITERKGGNYPDLPPDLVLLIKVSEGAVGSKIFSGY